MGRGPQRRIHSENTCVCVHVFTSHDAQVYVICPNLLYYSFCLMTFSIQVVLVQYTINSGQLFLQVISVLHVVM